jgi:hypothetical protein
MANPNPTPRPENLRPPWKPGESGNLKGRPVSKPLKAALDDESNDDPSLYRDLIKVAISRAKAGDFRYFKEIWDRVDGKVPTPVEVIEDTGIDYAEIPEPIDPERLD